METEEYDYEKEEMREKYRMGIQIQNEEAARFAQDQAQKKQMEISDEVARELGFKNTADYNFHVNSNPEATKAAQETFARVYKEGTKTVMSAATDVVRGRDSKGRFTKEQPLQPGVKSPARPVQPSNIAESVTAAKARANSGKSISDDTVNDILEMMLEDFR